MKNEHTYHKKKTMFDKSENRVKHVLKKVYSIISIISTLAVFGAIILFVIGRIGMVKMSDDDLIMNEIVSQMPDNLEINSIEQIDIHGLGNESIIVSASDKKYPNEDPVANQILIFDKIENNFLNQMYHFLGFGSKYKLSYRFSLSKVDNDNNASFGYYLNLLEAIELTGDNSKELIVEIMSIPAGTSACYEVAIISYSFTNHSYYVLGTYPEYNDKIKYNDSRTSISIIDNFHSDPLKECNYYDNNEKFNLTWCSHDNYYFHYVNKNLYNNYLVEARMIWESGESHVSPHRYSILIYSLGYDRERDEIDWYLNYCIESQEYLTGDAKEFVEKVLVDNNLDRIIK